MWLRKEKEPKNLTISDFTTKDNFIIVNPEEIGRQMYFEKKNFFRESILRDIHISIFQILISCDYVKLFNFCILAKDN